MHCATRSFELLEAGLSPPSMMFLVTFYSSSISLRPSVVLPWQTLGNMLGHALNICPSGRSNWRPDLRLPLGSLVGFVLDFLVVGAENKLVCVDGLERAYFDF